MIPVPTPRLVRLAGIAALASFALVVAPQLLLFLLVADAMLLAAALVDLLMTPGPGRFEVDRQVPARLSVLKDDRVGLIVRNRSVMTLDVRLIDESPDCFREPAPEVAGPVPRRGEAEYRYPVTPVRRGRFRWGRVHLRYRTVMGLWERGRIADAAADLTVYPNLTALEQYRLLAMADKVEAVDARPIRRAGGMAEFESLRDYTFGDDVRKLDWKATARRGKLIVRNERAERNQTVLLMIDSGRLMNAEEEGVSKLDHAVNAALLLAQVALSRGDRVGVCTYSHKVHSWLAPRGGVAQGKLIGENLCDLRGDYRESDPARVLQFIASRHPKRSLVVVITDFVDATTAGDLVTHLGLAARRHVVLLAALKDLFLERAPLLPLSAIKDGYRRAAAEDLLRDRQEVLEAVRHHGGFVIDAAPSDLTPRLLNRYMEIALRGIL